MQLFFSKDIQEKHILFDQDETRHAAQVLRKKIGDELIVMDGKGGEYFSRVSRIGKKEMELDVLRVVTHEKPKVQIHLAVAPTKNMDRVEWLLEKGIEIGLSSVHFVRCSRSERKQVNLERLEKIALAACKQSITWHFPELHDIQSFENFLTQADSQHGAKWMAVCEDAEFTLQTNTIIEEHMWILIGPEGDFTPEEYQAARAKGWKGVSLGDKRLRTETAALLAIAELNFVALGRL
ncbi:MAG: 16S rRNA (uracil(1498)-N(3))-methyltransferase [Bacteroidota bacterium]|nr:16S rRNA (uracil(1498)-N(3))-methyltransferase [Bacteroidota bacterium]MDX5431248.1 16S rRNA (uracil(1498)-N(3))-methyltransferase [Bacteroidota bacterium]MDX5469987.1 16S rRNA (uracil(1498)-N(3))-methyltransferase [Bacteroidota bacterium]